MKVNRHGNKNQIRQGDVLLVRIGESVGEGDGTFDGHRGEALSRDKKGRLVLAEGEISGHSHCFLDDSTVAVLEPGEDGGSRILVHAHEDTALQHVNPDNSPTGEHDPVPIPPGLYEYRPQTEYWDDTQWRKVSD